MKKARGMRRIDYRPSFLISPIMTHAHEIGWQPYLSPRFLTVPAIAVQ